MRAVVQRVRAASVSVDGQIAGEIGPGLLVYLGVATGDVQADTTYIATKILELRIFEDEDGRMNRSVRHAGGAVLLVSQFTLCGDARKGRRPSFDAAAAPADARAMYDAVGRELRSAGVVVETGVFQAHMAVTSVNDGPVTMLLDSRKVF
jgi:D-tyrosyl-tRNA(Tyr) deacylase